MRERLVAGDSDDAVRRFLTDRYGDFVRLSPPFRATTLLLWIGPAMAAEDIDLIRDTIRSNTIPIVSLESAKEASTDGRFTLKEGECMGACGDAPVLLVDNKRMCGFMSDDKLDGLLDELK